MKVELIIPHRDNDGSDNAEVIRQSVSHLCGVYGGATVYAAKGYWLNAEGHLYEDEVAVLVSAATDEVAALDDVRALARRVLDLTDQEAVFVSVNGRAEIIE